MFVCPFVRNRTLLNQSKRDRIGLKLTFWGCLDGSPVRGLFSPDFFPDFFQIL